MLAATSILEAALGYAELGYPVFPCAPGAKAPITEHGLYDATTDPDRIERWWQRTPTANVAIPTTGLLVVDVDPAGQDWLRGREGLEGELAVGAVQDTPRGGAHYFFRAPPGVELRNTAAQISRGVDTRATGGYVLAWPSVVDGKPYRWRPGLELALGPGGLPVAPPWLIDLLTSKPIRGEVLAGGGNRIPEGQRNMSLARLAGSMRRVGMTRSEIQAALEVVNRERCAPPLENGEVASIAASISRREPDQAWTAATEGWAYQDEVEPTEHDSTQPNDPGPFPHDLLAVPGFVGEVVQHNLATAHRQQPVLALAAALALQAVLSARKVRDQRGNRTNSYHIGVAPSGDGKDHARKLNRRILIEAGLELEGPEELASDAGLVAAVGQCPGLLLQVDEIGRFLRTVSSPEKNPHLYNVQTVLMKLYSQADSTFLGKAYADVKRRQSIVQPCVCVYGTTVPEHLYAALTPEALSDGFVARVLVFEGSANPPRREAAEAAVPLSIIEGARWWSRFRCASLSGVSSVPPDPQLVGHEHGAVEVFRELAAVADDQRTRLEGPARSIWARVEEKACRLALIYVCSMASDQLIVTRDAASWACRLAEYLTRRVLFIANRYVAENVFDAKRKRVLRAIEDAGPSGIEQNRLCRKTQAMTVRERLEILDALRASGHIIEQRTPSGGRPGTRLIAASQRTTGGDTA